MSSRADRWKGQPRAGRSIGMTFRHGVSMTSKTSGRRSVSIRSARLVVLSLVLSTALSGCAHSRVAGISRSDGTSPVGAPPSASTLTPATVASAPASSAPTTGCAASGSRAAAELAWAESERAFYAAGRLSEPEYPALIASFAPGSPALGRTVAWLIALGDAGVIAPQTYRVGGERVTRLTGSTAWLTGCTYDTGSVYRSTGAPAPGDLGGGASLTASVAVLRHVAGRWLVWSDQTSTPSSSEENGPCHGF